MIRDKEIGGPAGEAALAAALAGAAFLVRLAIDPIMGDRQPYTPGFAAIAFAVWFGGWRAGVLCTIATNILANYFFISPRGHFTLDATELTGSASFYFTAGIIIFLAQRARIANRQLQREAAQKDIFIATLSHELRNPLAPIVSAARILERSVPPEGAARQAVAILERQSAHMRRLLDDLLDMSRIRRGGIALRREPVDLCRCTRDACDSVRDACEAKGQRMELACPGEGLVLTGDATRITQIVANLVGNACKYSPEGSWIAVRCECRGGEACITVSDNGPGIGAERLATLFEAFSNNDPRGDKPDSGGLGMGLWLANRLATMHGGRIDVRSVEGSGTEFRVYLPVAGATGAARSA